MSQREIIHFHLHTHSQQTGFEIPHLLEQYLVDLLTARLDRVDIIPEPSFAERYLMLYNCRNSGEIREFGDTALFFVSLMPEYGRRRGLDMDYYATLGISAYYAWGDLTEDPRGTQLGNWFYPLQRFLNTAIRPDQRLDLGFLQ